MTGSSDKLPQEAAEIETIKAELLWKIELLDEEQCRDILERLGLNREQ